MLKRVVYHLSEEIGARGSATSEEKRAANYCKDLLKGMGYEVIEQRFKALTTFSWLYITFYLWPLVAWALDWPLLSLLGSILFFMDLNTYQVLSRVFPTGASQNIYATHPKGQGRQVVLVAHLDSSKAGLNFSPAMVKGFRTSFLLMVASLCAAPILLFVASLWGGAWRFVALLPCLYLAFASITLIHREIWNRYTNGANDNASGVGAVLAVAERFKATLPDGVQLSVLLTGCEEAGTYGMIRFLEEYGSRHKESVFVNLDNIGAGSLHYMSGEGMFPVFKAPTELIEACQRVAKRRPELGVKQGVYNLLSTDAMPALVRGYKAVSFLSMNDEGLLPNWHWPTDTFANVELKTVETAVEFVAELVADLGQQKTQE
ncbi:MAG: M28 family peptidase [Peptococcaceae bacterium]|nr:M28 family peptidase [Peptococcaceae bacterium]